MRLVVMAQGDSSAVVRAFLQLPEDDRKIMSEEMAVTGCLGQSYSSDPLTNSKYNNMGPAVLIYYAPALMQKAGRQDPTFALVALAELFRQTRELWPLASEDADKTVIVRIDALKELLASKILQPDAGMSWVLAKCSARDAAVKLLPVATFKELDWGYNQVLTFAQGARDPQKWKAKTGSRGLFRKITATLSMFERRLSRRPSHASSEGTNR